MLPAKKRPLSEITYYFVAKYLQKAQEVEKQIVKCPHNYALQRLTHPLSKNHAKDGKQRR